MLFIESLTVSGIPGLDDHTLRLRPGLNLFPIRRPQPSYVIRFLTWFLNHSEASDLQLEMAFGRESYLEIRIRSDQPQYAFWVLSGKKQRNNSRDQKLISLRRVLSKPHTVSVEGGRSLLEFETFRQEMQQLGLRFGTVKFPMLNVVRGEDLDRWIKSARKLWEIVHDVFQVDVFSRMQTVDQDRKGFCRQKMDIALSADYQDRIDELQARIDGSKTFRKMVLTVDMNAAMVAQREVKAYEVACRDCEGQLMEAVSQAEVLDEKRKKLEDRLDELESVVPDVRELLAVDLDGECEEEERCLALHQSEEQTIETVDNMYRNIEDLVRKMQDSVEGMLGRIGKWLQACRKVAELEVEIEINENCMHAALLPSEIRENSLQEFQKSLEAYLETSRTRLKQLSNETELLNLTVLAHRQVLKTGRMGRERAVQIEHGEDSINEWSGTFKKLTQTKLLTVFLQTEVRQKSAQLLQHIPEDLSLESVQGMASIQHFLHNSIDHALKQNFIGFVWQHLKFKESALAAKVAALALPHLSHLFDVAVFKEHDPMTDLINQLSSRYSYNVLPVDVFTYSKTPFKVPSRVHPLSSLLLESPLKKVLTQLMDKFYYTNAPFANIAGDLDEEIILICAHDDDEIVIGGDGIVAGGWTRNAERTLEKLSEAVSLQVEIFRLKSELGKQCKIVPKLRECLEQTWDAIEQLREDAFDRYHELHRAYPKIAEMPSIMGQLFHQEKILARQKVRFDHFTKFSQHLKTAKLNDRDWYQKQIDKQQKSLEKARDTYNDHVYDRDLIQFKHDVRVLGELLTQAAALHTISLPINLHKTLMNSLVEHEGLLKDSLQVLENERTAAQSPFDTFDQLDVVQRDMIEPEQKMLSFNYRYLELTGFLQDLRRQFPPIKFQTSKPKTIVTNLQRVYEARLALNNTQPGYKPEQLERFKLKIELCRAELDLLTDHRKFVVANMTLPCVDKLMALKLRLITQMVAEVPSYLGKPGSLRLNFQYDQTRCSHEALGESTFQMDYIVGLAVDFVDDEGSYVRCLDEDSAVLPHLTFFLSLLSVEGCKLLVLDDAFANLAQDAQQEVFKILELMSRSMQIFAAVESEV